jgi:hypothetical protein
MLRRLLIPVAAAASVAAAVVPIAAADPGNAKNAAQIHAVCGAQTINVVVNGNGEFTPAHVVGSTAVFIPTKFDITFTFTPTGGSAMSDHDTSAKKGPLKNMTTCTIPMQTLFSGPEGTATIVGTVTGFFTPRSH